MWGVGRLCNHTLFLNLSSLTHSGLLTSACDSLSSLWLNKERGDPGSHKAVNGPPISQAQLLTKIYVLFHIDDRTDFTFFKRFFFPQGLKRWLAG